jgi:hypothetical protein
MSERHCSQGQRESESVVDVAEQDDRIDRALLGLLLRSGPHGLWSLEELGREIGDSLYVQDAVNRLHGQGLIHRLGDFVFVTRAAARVEELAQ